MITNVADTVTTIVTTRLATFFTVPRLSPSKLNTTFSPGVLVQVPEQIDAQKRKRLFDLRIHLGMKMDELAKLCSIPPADYKDMENGKLIKAKATRYMTIIFRKYKRELESIEL